MNELERMTAIAKVIGTHMPNGDIIVNKSDMDRAMSTTNDEQAPYGTTTKRAAENAQRIGAEFTRLTPSAYDAGNALNKALKDKPTERAPLLSDEILKNGFAFRPASPHAVRDFYEAKITSGELIKTEMFYDRGTGMVTLRILNTQWTMSGDDVFKRIEETNPDLALVWTDFAASEQTSVVMDVLLKHGAQTAKA